jgi:hypothetical protein
MYSAFEYMFKGILKANNPGNPFNDWNFCVLPYTTGDLHFGNHAFPYTAVNGKQKILLHNGQKNTKIALEHCKEIFPAAAQVFVMGDSAGAFGAVGNAPVVADTYPDTERITVFSDAAQIRTEKWYAILKDIWRVDDEISREAEGSDQLLIALTKYAAKKLGGKAVFLRQNTLHDVDLTRIQNELNFGVSTTEGTAANNFYRGLAAAEKLFAASGIAQYSMITAHHYNPQTNLTQHTMLRTESFYAKQEDVETKLCDWLFEAANGRYTNLGQEFLNEEYAEKVLSGKRLQRKK